MSVTRKSRRTKVRSAVTRKAKIVLDRLLTLERAYVDPHPLLVTTHQEDQLPPFLIEEGTEQVLLRSRFTRVIRHTAILLRHGRNVRWVRYDDGNDHLTSVVRIKQ